MGDWRKLKPATIARRRKGKGAGPKAAILWDTGTLIGGLNPSLSRAQSKGGAQTDLQQGVIVGYGGPAKHPKGKMTVARLAEIHHFGLGKVPARPITVEPDRKTLDAMAGDVANYWRKTAK